MIPIQDPPRHRSVSVEKKRASPKQFLACCKKDACFWKKMVASVLIPVFHLSY